MPTRTRKRKGRKRVRRRQMLIPRSRNTTYGVAKSHSVAKIHRTLTSHIYDFVRYSEDPSTDFTFAASNISFSGFAFDYRLLDVANHSEFTNLFDSYQICKVQLEFIPDVSNINRQIGDTTAAGYTVPLVYVHRDLDNATAPTSEAQMSQRQSVVVKKATDRFTISLVPQIGREVYRTAVSTAYETPYKVVWLDTSYSDIPHYGIHVGITPTGSASGAPRFQYKIKTQYWLRFKKAK